MAAQLADDRLLLFFLLQGHLKLVLDEQLRVIQLLYILLKLSDSLLLEHHALIDLIVFLLLNSLTRVQHFCFYELGRVAILYTILNLLLQLEQHGGTLLALDLQRLHLL